MLLPLPITHTYIYIFYWLCPSYPLTGPLPPPDSVQNSNTVKRQPEYPSFPFGTNGAHSPCVLASPLAPIVNVVRMS